VTDAGPLVKQAAGAGPRPARWLRTALLVAQVAGSIVLLTGAGLLARTVNRLLEEDTGVTPRGALTVRLMLSESTRFDAGSRATFVRELLREVRSLPEVEHAGVGSTLPPRMSPLVIGVRFVSDSRDEFRTMSLASMTPAYFQALGGALVGGRYFEEADAGRPVALISESVARDTFLSEDPIGRELPFRLMPAQLRAHRHTVIGVVRDVKYQGLDSPPGGAVYVQWDSLPSGISYLVVRTAGDPRRLAEPIRRLIAGLDEGMPVPAVETLEEEMSGSIAERRLRVVPAASFALLALVVAVIGLSGAVSRSVAERRREIAVRMALGASARRTVRLMLREPFGAAGAGVALGVACAWTVARSLAHLLYGVSPRDLTTFAAAVALVAVAAVAASYLPARRAARIDPMELLRE
jgi:putative ABC transport system permease protein